jgi:hypothetical protein
MMLLPMVRHPLTCVRVSVLLEAAAAGLVDRAWAFSKIRSGARVLANAPRAEGPAAAEIARSALDHCIGNKRGRDTHLERAIGIAQKGKMGTVERMARRALALCRGNVSEVGRLETELRSVGVTEPSAWARFVTPTLVPDRGHR